MKRKAVIPCILTMCLVLTSCGSEDSSDVEQEQEQEQLQTEQTSEGLTPVETMTVSKSNLTNNSVYSGKVEPSQSVDVSSKTGGKVESTNFEVGDQVQQGDVMFTVDQQATEDQIKNLESQLEIANQSVIAAQNNLDTVKGGQYQNQIQQLESSIETANKQVENSQIALQNAELAQKNAQLALDNANNTLSNAQTSYDNAKILYDAGIINKNEYDKAELALKQAQFGVEQAQSGVEQADLAYNQAVIGYDQAVASLDTAQSTLDLNEGQLVEDNVTKASIALDQAIASRDAIQVQLDIAQESLQDSYVTAPISGVVSNKNVKEGQMTSSQAPAYSIVNTSKVNVAEQMINKISMGQTLDVYVKAVKNEPFTGTIVEISPVADTSGTYPVKVEIDNDDNFLKPGMFAEVYFPKESTKDTIVIPRDAVMNDGNIDYVYVVNNGVAEMVEVTTGIDDGVNIEITSGLKVGDEVITKGQTYVINGAKVNVVSGGNK